MTELPRPNIKKDSSWSAIWILPLLALGLGAWLLWRAFSEAGIEIYVHFADGEGIQVGKTQVIYKGISLGKVIDLKVSPDLQGVNAKIEINREAREYLSQATRFWLVKPRVSLAGVTGLETIVSGIYIAIDPVRGDFTQNYSALIEPPPLSDRLPGLHLTLKADRLGSLEQGSPVYYRQIQVGQIKSYKLTEDQRTVEIQVYIEPAYTNLVKQHTRFWNASGISVSGGLSGFKVRSESLLSLASGGISFITPEHYQESPAADGTQPFHLYDDYEDAEIGLKVRVKLKDVSGMQAGRTPVIYNGLQVGTLKWIDMGRDFSQPVAELNMDPRTEELLLTSSDFWVVKPSVSLAGISGLETLVQGNYLAVRFGKEGKPSREFTARVQAPPLRADDPGLHLVLASERLGSLAVGSPLLFRQMKIGSVQGYQLADDRSHVLVSVHVEAEYAKLINQSTRFWNASGVRLKGGLNTGIELNSESLQTLLAGGIALQTPDSTAPAVGDGRRFTLFNNEAQANASGVVLELRLPRAEGLREGTLLRYRGLEVGRVESVRLENDLQGVVLHVRVTDAGERIARVGSQFWVVRPEVSLMRIANLDSVVSGPYLEVEPAPRSAAVQTRFDVRADAPRENASGLPLVLSATRRGSLHPGVAVTYREIPVGRVTRVELGPHADRVLVHVVIEPRYSALVRAGSRFWNASGVGVDVSLFKGAQIRTESLEAMLQGGIAFATPDEQRPAQAGQTFVLFDEPQPEWQQWAPRIPLQP